MPNQSKHRILMVVTALGKWGEISGVAYSHQNFLKQFQKNNIPVDVVTYGPKNNYEVDGSVRIITHKPVIPISVDVKLKVDLLANIPGLTRRLSVNSYTLVHNAAPDALGIMATNLAKKYNYPIVSIYHTALDEYVKLRLEQTLGNSIGTGLGKLSREIMQRYLLWHYNQSNLILAPSETIKQSLEQKYTPPVKVLPRGVDSQEFSPQFRRRKEGYIQATYIGRIAAEKNLDILANIFKSRKNVRLKIVGDGPYLKELKKKLPQAKFTGALFGKKLSRAYADTDIFVFPSETETFGNVTLQAMSSSVPVVVMNKMAAAELVKHKINGFICSNQEEFSAAIDKLAGDHYLRQQMGMAGREFALTQSWEKIFGQLLMYYDSAAQTGAQ